MTVREQHSASDARTAGAPARSVAEWVGSIGRRLAAWAETCADYYAAAAMYEELSALSNAELARRGLSRATLAHDVRVACDRNLEP